MNTFLAIDLDLCANCYLIKVVLVSKDPDAEKDNGKKENGKQRIRWLDGFSDSMGIEFEETLGDSEGQESLACCSSWGLKESDTALGTE